MIEVDIETVKKEIGPLLERVTRGEQVSISESGQVVVHMTPAAAANISSEITPKRQQSIRDAVARMDARRSLIQPSDYSWTEMKKLRDFGRR